MQLIGSPEAIEDYLATHPEAAARAARAIFSDENALLSFELGEAAYPAPIERQLDRMIARRNAAEDRA